MNSLERVLNSNAVLVTTHILVVILFVSLIYYNNNGSYCNNINKQLIILNDTTTQELARYDNIEAYENSLSFQEKGLKNRAFKLKDEVVVDTATVEPLPVNPQENFIPIEKTEDENNLISWLNYFNGKKSNNIKVLVC